jgi:hypothetical protein
MAIRYVDEPTQPKKFRYVDEEAQKQEEPKGNFIQRALEAAKEFVFPFSAESQGRLLSPTPGKFGPSKIAEELGAKVGDTGIDVVKSGAEALAESPFGQKNPGTSAAIGTGAQMATEMAAPMLRPSGQAAYIGGELAGPVMGGMFKNAARGLTKETLGMTRSSLTSTKSPFESARKMTQANRVAEKALEEGTISVTGRPAPMIDDANKMFEYGKKQVDGVLKQFDNYGKNVRDLASPDSPIKLQSPNRLEARQAAELIMKKLSPKYDDEIAASKHLLNDLAKHAENGLTVREAEGLIQRWGKKGFTDKTVTMPEADAYRAGWEVLKKRLQQHFDEVAPELANQYKQGKEYEEAALISLKGLYNRQASLETTSAFEPFQFVKRVVEHASGPTAVGLNKVGNVLRGPLGGLKVAAANAAGASVETLQNPLDIVTAFKAGKISYEEAKQKLREKLGL